MGLGEELGFRAGFQEDGHEMLLGVYYTASVLRKRAADFFRARDVSDVQFNVLILLRHQSGETGGLTQVELSRMLLVNPGNITTLIDRMEKAGLVERAAVGGDRRYNLVRLTARGSSVLDSCEEDYFAEVRRLTQDFSPEEQTALLKLLERLRAQAR